MTAMTTMSTRNSMILASAGTGKTFQLSNRYIRLLLDGAHPKSILATTFTRKAAGEILDRIVTRLADAAGDETIARATSIELGRPDTSRIQFGNVLKDLVQNLNSLQVETLDAFFYRIAKAFSLDMGMSPDWQVAQENQARALSQRAIRRSLNRKSTVSIVHDLAKGEAKRSIGAMIRDTVKSLYEIFRETCDTNRLDAWAALKEMPLLSEQRIEELHSSIRHLEYQGSDSFRKKVDSDLAKIARRDWDALLKSGVFSKVAEGATTFFRKEIDSDLLKLMQPLARHAVARNINLLVKQTRGAFEFLQAYHRNFHRLKLDSGLLEFDDIAYYASLLFSRYSYGRLAWRLDQSIDHLLLDEFQDTSIQQWQILRPLADQVCVEDQRKSFFCVGDVKQAIYGWRGGVAEIFDEVHQHYQSALNDVDSLSKSFRSSPVVIEAVNSIFQNIGKSKVLGDRKEMFESWVDKFQIHQTARQDIPGSVTFETTNDEGPHFAQVAASIGKLRRQFPGKTIGVLARENKDVAELIFELGNAGIHASEEGGNPLTDSAGVNILLSGLRLLDHPDDLVSRFHVLHSPLGALFGLTTENFRKPGHTIRQRSQEMRRQLINHGYGELLASWAALLDDMCTEREWFRIGQLIEKGYRVSVADHLRTAEFVSWIESEKVADPTSAAVNVMTIHKSKGLEFDIVVLPALDFGRGKTPRYIVGRENAVKPIDLVCRYMDGLKQGWLPEEFQDAFDAQREREIHEFLCTIYVALTRAKHAIQMIATPDSHAEKKDAAGLIMAALEIDYHKTKNPRQNQVLWERTDPEWKKLAAAENSMTTDDGGRMNMAETKSQISADGSVQTTLIAFAPSSTNRNVPWESPSSREGGDLVQLGRLLQLEDNGDARLYGSLIHACFEQVKWMDDPKSSLPADPVLRQTLVKIPGAELGVVRKAISEFRRMLKKPNTSRLLMKGQYTDDLFQSYDQFTVQNERAFAVQIGDGVLQGFIDRLVLLWNDGVVVAADVIDFKTDSLKPGDSQTLHQRTAVYKPQLQGYRDAVAQIYGLPTADVSARLMFVAIDQQVSIA